VNMWARRRPGAVGSAASSHRACVDWRGSGLIVLWLRSGAQPLDDGASTSTTRFGFRRGPEAIQSRVKNLNFSTSIRQFHRWIFLANNLLEWNFYASNNLTTL
jgi:hypothetical protein